MAYYHYAELIQRQAEKYGSRAALMFRNPELEKWEDISWTMFANQVDEAAKGLAELGVQPQDRIGVYSQNMPQYLYTDFATYSNRAITVPLYATNSVSQVEFIVKDAEIAILFVGEQLQYNNAYKVQKSSDVLKKIIIFDSKVTLNPEDTTSLFFEDFLKLGDTAEAATTVKVRRNEAAEEDIASILYTSGTTGNSKGVVLTHSNFLCAMESHDERFTMVTDKDISFSFLPMTHIFEKAWSYYCAHKGVKNAINLDPRMVQKTLPEVRPTLLCNVPRFWEKIYSGVNDKINNSSPMLQKVFRHAMAVGKEYVFEYRHKNRRPPIGLYIQFSFFNKFLFRKLKEVVGIDRGSLFPVGGAPLNAEVDTFLQSVNIPICVGYGLSETVATVTSYPGRGFEVGTLGKPMPNLELKIDPKTNEILVKGNTVMTGYYKSPNNNADTFTADGFFRTGDAGILREDGVLIFKERIKDLYKTSNGKYIAPQLIEGQISTDKYIDQIAIIGDQRKFVSALVVPDFIELDRYIKAKGLVFESRQAMVESVEINKLIESRIEFLQKGLASYEKIKRFTILPQAFTMDRRELTDTLKLRRPVVAENYRGQIEAMYQE